MHDVEISRVILQTERRTSERKFGRQRLGCLIKAAIDFQYVRLRNPFEKDADGFIETVSGKLPCVDYMNKTGSTGSYRIARPVKFCAAATGDCIGYADRSV